MFCRRQVSTVETSGFTKRVHEEIMREREEEIRNINRGMHQVNEITYGFLSHPPSVVRARTSLLLVTEI